MGVEAFTKNVLFICQRFCPKKVVVKDKLEKRFNFSQFVYFRLSEWKTNLISECQHGATFYAGRQ